MSLFDVRLHTRTLFHFVWIIFLWNVHMPSLRLLSFTWENWAIQSHSVLVYEADLCIFISMFWVIVLLQGEPISRSQVFCRLEQVFFLDSKPYHQTSAVIQPLLMQRILIMWWYHHHASLYGRYAQGFIIILQLATARSMETKNASCSITDSMVLFWPS